MRKLISFLLLLLIHPLLYAVEEKDVEVAFDDTQIEELMWLKKETIEISSKKIENKSAAAAIVSVISSDDIERYGANDLFEVLNRVTSTYMLGEPVWAKGGISMRGDSFGLGAHILMLINGRPLRDSLYGGINEVMFRSFPLHHIEQIEVMRGAGSALYGTNAYSGIINVVTKKQKDNLVNVRGRYGSSNSGQVETELAWKNQDIKLNGAARYHSTDGNQFVAKNVNNQQSHFQTEDHEISASLTAEWNDWTLNGFIANAGAKRWGAAYTAVGVPFRLERLFLDLGYKKEFNSHWVSQWNLTYNQQTHQQYNPDNLTTISALNARENNLLFEQTQHLNFFDNKLNVLIGGLVEWQNGIINQESGGGNTLPEYHRLKSSIYGEISYALLSNLKLTAGGQWHSTDNLRVANETSTGTVGKLALVYEITPHLGTKLLYNQAYRLANAFQLGNHSTTYQGNAALLPESVETIDAQVFYHAKDLQASLTAFRSRQSNLIVTVCKPGLCPPITYTNRDSTLFAGLELEMQGTLFKNWHWQGSYSFQTNKNKQNQNNATQMPNHLAKIGLSWDATPDLQLSAFDVFSSKAKVLPTVPAYNPFTKNYHNVTVQANYHLDSLLGLPAKKRLTFSFYLDNALNQTFYYPEFNLRRVNTMPGNPGSRSLFGEFVIEF